MRLPELPEGRAARGHGPLPEGPHSMAYGWGAPWAPSPEVPYALGAAFHTGSEEVLGALAGCPRLFPPYLPGAGGSGAAAAAQSAAEPASAPGAHAGGQRTLNVEGAVDLSGQYSYAYVKSDRAKRLVEILLAPARLAAHGRSLADALSKALARFAKEAHDQLLMTSGGNWVIPEEDRHNLVNEAGRAMETLVTGGHVKFPNDFIFCLEAFGVSKGVAVSEQQWLCECLRRILDQAVLQAPEEHTTSWRETMRNRMRGESGELYSNVDVRAWPYILKLIGTDCRAIEPEEFKTQVRLQLCMHPELRSLYDGLQQAATLIADLRQAQHFGADQLREVFNDRIHLERQKRFRLLSIVLRDAPRQLVQEVLRAIDGNDVDISERNDDELLLVRELLVALHEDIRCCKHVFFQMKSDWIAGRRAAIENENLSPEQICDHIEDEDNHEELLKVAVNKYLKLGRKCEAAKMLARRESANTRVYETNRNDKQLAYLLTLYKDMEPGPRNFGPVEQSTLVLPCSRHEVLYIGDSGDALQRLERETLKSGRPMAIGLWWFWRCFDPKLDFWPRASFIAFSYDRTFAIVDFQRLEEAASRQVERRGKAVVREILEASFLLKVVHDMDGAALQVLQRAVVPVDELLEESPEWPSLAPVLDLALVAAWARNTCAAAPAVTKLSGLVFDYLRLELCLAEALSNFERRPLRDTQLHYALTLAWCPLLVLRTLCAFDIVTLREALLMTLRVGLAVTPLGWDLQLRRISLGSEPTAGLGSDRTALDMNGRIPGGHAVNLWDNNSQEAIDWRNKLPKPDRGLDLEKLLGQHVRELLLLPEAKEVASRSLETVFDKAAAKHDLEALYRAYHSDGRGDAV